MPLCAAEPALEERLQTLPLVPGGGKFDLVVDADHGPGGLAEHKDVGEVALTSSLDGREHLVGRATRIRSAVRQPARKSRRQFRPQARAEYGDDDVAMGGFRYLGLETVVSAVEM